MENEPNWLIHMRELRERKRRRRDRQSNQLAKLTEAVINQMNQNMAELIEDSLINGSSRHQGKDVSTFDPHVAQSLYSDHPIIEEFVSENAESETVDLVEEGSSERSSRSSLNLESSTRHSNLKRASSSSHRSHHPVIEESVSEDSDSEGNSNITMPISKTYLIEQPSSDEDAEIDREENQSIAREQRSNLESEIEGLTEERTLDKSSKSLSHKRSSVRHSISEHGNPASHHNSNSPCISKNASKNSIHDSRVDVSNLSEKGHQIEQPSSHGEDAEMDQQETQSIRDHHSNKESEIEDLVGERTLERSSKSLSRKRSSTRHSISKHNTPASHHDSNSPFTDKNASKNSVHEGDIGIEQQEDQSIQEHHSYIESETEDFLGETTLGKSSKSLSRRRSSIRHSLSKHSTPSPRGSSNSQSIDNTANEGSIHDRRVNVSTTSGEDNQVEQPSSYDEDLELELQETRSIQEHLSVIESGAEDFAEERTLERSSKSLVRSRNSPRHSTSKHSSPSSHHVSDLTFIDKTAKENSIQNRRVNVSTLSEENCQIEQPSSDDGDVDSDQQEIQSIHERRFTRQSENGDNLEERTSVRSSKSLSHRSSSARHSISKHGTPSLHHNSKSPSTNQFASENSIHEKRFNVPTPLADDVDVEMDQQEDYSAHSISKHDPSISHYSNHPVIEELASVDSNNGGSINILTSATDNYVNNLPVSEDVDMDDGMDQQGERSIQQHHSISKHANSSLHHDSNPPIIDKIAAQNKFHHKRVNSSSRLPEVQPHLVRRSTRPRWKPLEYWRGERPKYVRDGDTFTYVSTQPGRPDHDYSRKQPRRCKSPSKVQSRVSPQEYKVPSGCVVPPDYEFQKSRTGEFDLISTDLNGMILGKLIIGPGKRKQEAKISINLTYLLFVLKGRVILKNTTPKKVKYYIDDNPLRSHVTLKGGTSYSITNVGKEAAHILYMTRITEDQ